MADLLFEAGLEEIPARMIAAAEAELTERVVELLRRERLLRDEHEVHSYSTPRRLAVQVNGVLARQPDARRETTGPAWSVAFRMGNRRRPAQAFARKAGVAVEALEKISTPKGEYVSANVLHRGREASEVLGDLLAAELAASLLAEEHVLEAAEAGAFCAAGALDGGAAGSRDPAGGICRRAGSESDVGTPHSARRRACDHRSPRRLSGAAGGGEGDGGCEVAATTASAKALDLETRSVPGGPLAGGHGAGRDGDTPDGVAVSGAGELPIPNISSCRKKYW